MFEPFFNSCVCTDSARGSQTSACHCMFTQSANHSNQLCSYREHLDNTAKLVETGIQTMEESEMALFLQVCQVFLL